MAEQPEERSIGKIRDEIDEKVTALFEYNQKVVAVLRDKAKDWEMLATFFEQQKQRCFDVQELHLEMAATAAEMTGDILIAEFGSLGGHGSDDDEDEAATDDGV